MEPEILRQKKKMKLLWKILIGIFLFIVIVAGTLFTAGYFYYGKLIKTYIIEYVSRESKGIYTANIDYIYIDFLNGNLTIRGVTLNPDTARYRKMMAGDTLSPMLFRVRIRFFKVENFRVMEVFREKKLNISDIKILEPEIALFRMQAKTRESPEEKKGQRIMSIPLPKGLNSIAIGEILFKKGTFDFYDLTGDSVIHQSIPSCTISVRNILVDSLHQGKMRLFNSDDISVVMNGLSFKTPDGLNLISLGEIGLSTAGSTFYIKNFQLIPQYDRAEYSKRFGWQTDRLDIRVDQLRFDRLDFRRLLFEGKFIAGRLSVGGLDLDDYRDKRVPRKPGFRPAMPQDGLRNLKSYLKIDTVVLKNGKATYAEQVGKEPGTIFFDNMNATLTGLTNDSAMLAAGLVSVLKGTAYMMGKGRMDLELRFHFGDKRNRFSFSATLGVMDLRLLNPMLTKLLPAEIISGNITVVTVPPVSADDDEARGKIICCYTGLKFKVNSEKESTWNSIKDGVINWVANDLLVNNDNPSKSGKLKTGVIFYRRDKEKGIINFVWKCVLSGLKSQMGFNSEEQKAMKKKVKNRDEKKK